MTAIELWTLIFAVLAFAASLVQIRQANAARLQSDRDREAARMAAAEKQQLEARRHAEVLAVHSQRAVTTKLTIREKQRFGERVEGGVHQAVTVLEGLVLNLVVNVAGGNKPLAPGLMVAEIFGPGDMKHECRAAPPRPEFEFSSGVEQGLEIPLFFHEGTPLTKFLRENPNCQVRVRIEGTDGSNHFTNYAPIKEVAGREIGWGSFNPTDGRSKFG